MEKSRYKSIKSRKQNKTGKKEKKKRKVTKKNKRHRKEMDTTEAPTHFMNMHEAGNARNICINTHATQQQSRGYSRGMTREV